MKLKLIAAAVTLGLICSQAYADDAMQGQNAAAQPGTTASNSVDAKQAGENFLKKNKAKPGVVTLADGLQYKILKKGDGPKPGPNDVVTVDYAGKLIDGTEFDSSDKHGGPSSFTVGQVIPGWVEALQLMPTGSTWELYIPSNLAYGEQGSPPAIGPNETLIFKVKLIKLQKGS
jgi:FKBP-type peptidyl-prolyl cis-trans isomerase FklB